MNEFATIVKVRKMYKVSFKRPDEGWETKEVEREISQGFPNMLTGDTLRAEELNLSTWLNELNEMEMENFRNKMQERHGSGEVVEQVSEPEVQTTQTQEVKEPKLEGEEATDKQKNTIKNFAKYNGEEAKGMIQFEVGAVFCKECGGSGCEVCDDTGIAKGKLAKHKASTLIGKLMNKFPRK